MIPKKIHYCWFGKGKKNKLFYKCYKSWQKYFPDFEIIEWNESNFDLNFNKYVKEAYNLKKYAFVSDVARLKIIYDNGGIYFDTDVEVLKRFPENILEKGYFAEESDSVIATGLGFAAYPKNKAVKIMLDEYKNLHFVDENDLIDLTACPIRNMKSLIDAGYEIKKGRANIIDGVPVYSKEYFCGFDISTNHYIITDKTLSVHHYNASWLSKKEKIIIRLKRWISKIIGEKYYNKIKNKKNNR